MRAARADTGLRLGQDFGQPSPWNAVCVRKMGEEPIASPDALQRFLGRHTIGETLTVHVLRGKDAWPWRRARPSSRTDVSAYRLSVRPARPWYSMSLRGRAAVNGRLALTPSSLPVAVVEHPIDALTSANLSF